MRVHVYWNKSSDDLVQFELARRASGLPLLQEETPPEESGEGETYDIALADLREFVGLADSHGLVVQLEAD